MNITFTEHKTVEIRMDEYVQECLDSFGENITMGAATLAKKDLYKTGSDAMKLNLEKEEKCHHIVAKLSYVSK